MVLNTAWVATVATLSADFCQYIACNPQRLRSQDVLDLIFCFPLHQLRRLALCLFSFFCFPPPVSAPSYYIYNNHDSSSSSSSSSDDDAEASNYQGYDSHSD